MPMSQVVAEFVPGRKSYPSWRHVCIVVNYSPAIARVAQRIQGALKSGEVAALDGLQRIFRKTARRHLDSQLLDVDGKSLVAKNRAQQLGQLCCPLFMTDCAGRHFLIIRSNICLTLSFVAGSTVRYL